MEVSIDLQPPKKQLKFEDLLPGQLFTMGSNGSKNKSDPCMKGYTYNSYIYLRDGLTVNSTREGLHSPVILLKPIVPIVLVEKV